MTVDRAPTPSSNTSPPARLSLTPPSTARRPLDGAWWPRSHDLAAELPALAGALDAFWGRITRITVNPRLWPVVPRKVPVSGHLVHVGWFTEQDPYDLLLLSSTVGRWDLLVVPPETDPAAAARLMAAAADPHNQLTASRLMAAENTGRRSAEFPEAVDILPALKGRGFLPRLRHGYPCAAGRRGGFPVHRAVPGVGSPRRV